MLLVKIKQSKRFSAASARFAYIGKWKCMLCWVLHSLWKHISIFCYILLHFFVSVTLLYTPIHCCYLIMCWCPNLISDKDKNQFEEKDKNQFTQIISVTLPSLTWHWWSTQNCRHSTTTIRNKESMTWWGTHGWSHTFCNLNKYI